MRIAIVHSYYATDVPSGENNVVADQVALLRDAGHDVLEVSRYTDEQRRTTGYVARSALRVITGRGDSPAQALTDFAPDVVHLHNTFPNWGTAWLEQWGNRTVATLHNYRTVCANGLLFRDGHPCQDCLRTPVLPALRHRCYRGSAVATLPVALASAPSGSLRRVARRAARLVALNPAAADLLAEQFDREVLVVPNFVAAADGPRGERGEHWGYVGRFSAEKGIRELIRAWPDDEYLDLVGSGPLLSEIEQLLATRPQIHLLGAQARAELRDRMATWRGVVVPSLWSEGLPTVALEALAAGTPLLLSEEVTAGPTMVQAGAACSFDPLTAPEELRHQLPQHLGRLRSDWMQMSARARDLHESTYSPQAWLDQMEPIYRSV